MGDVEGCGRVVHGRSRTTMEPLTPTTKGRIKSYFERTGGHRLHQALGGVNYVRAEPQER